MENSEPNELPESTRSENIESSGKKSRVLFIDDDEVQLRMWRLMLKSTGDITSELCKKKEDAIAAIDREVEKAGLDIIFLDHNLEDGAVGLEIAKYVQEKYPQIKIYSTTSDAKVVPEYEKIKISHVRKDAAGFPEIKKIISAEK